NKSIQLNRLDAFVFRDYIIVNLNFLFINLVISTRITGKIESPIVIAHSIGFNMVKLNIFLITGTNKIISNKTKDDNNAKNKYLLCPFPFVKIESVLDLW